MSELRYTKDGVPIFDGSSELYVPYRRAALNYVETLEWKKRSLAGPRLQAALEGSARVAVQHKTPGWISHHEGASQLLEFLKTKVQAPTLAEAGKMISRFFYSIKRRKGESMNAWIVRHDESLFEARRTLAEAIQEYGSPHGVSSFKKSASQVRSYGTTHPVMADVEEAESSSHHPEEQEQSPFDEHGRMREEISERHYDHASNWSGSQAGWKDWNTGWWSNQDWWRQSWPTPQPSSVGKYDVSEAASSEADKFLPDFVVAWMLLQRSGLDGTERGTIIANLKNRFTTTNVKNALKLAWPEEDLRKRDQSRGATLLVDDDENDILLQLDGEESDSEFFGLLNESDQSEYSNICSDVDHAFQAFHQARRTLRDAREKQSTFRKNRQFYPMKRDGQPGRAKPDSGFTPKCFKCGGNHHTSKCTQGSSSTTTGSAHLAFTLSGVSEPEATVLTANRDVVEETEHGLSLHQIMSEGKAIIDGGATSSVGSVSALDKVLELQHSNQLQPEISVAPEEQSQFRFGNNGKTRCLSSTILKIPLNQDFGSMKIHVHDIEGQPILLSVSALRSLKGVIDFERDEMILKAVNPSRVISLERAPSGHQVFPLAEDIMKNSQPLSRPFSTFQAFCSE